MPDIAMCPGDGCLKKAACYRYRAVPTARRQSYFAKTPIAPDGSCDHFLKLREGDKLADLPPEEA